VSPGGTERESPDGTERESPDGTEQGFFHVSGMYGRTCESFLESVACSQSGVTDADASYVTESISVTYDPDRTDEGAIADALSTTGYRALSRTETTGEAAATVLADAHGETRELEDLLGFRYVAGVMFGMFLLFPYIVVFYPAQYDLLPVEFFADGTVGSGVIPLLMLLAGTTAVVVLFTGLPLLRGAYVSLRTRQPNTDLLATLTILAAFTYSTATLLAGRIDIYFDLAIVVAATVVAAIYYESLVKRWALERLTDLTIARTEEARVVDADETEMVDIEDLAPGQRVLVREGERVPVDGTLATGQCTVDESVVTGESRPVTREAGERVVGGSVVTGDAAVLTVGDPPTSSIDRLTTAVWLLQSATHGLQRRADRLATAVVPVVAALAVLGGVVALGLGRGGYGALSIALAVVLVGSPWGLALATPLSVAGNLRDALARGIVVSDETVFERLRETDTVVFDKTGTLTAGELRVVEADAPRETLSAAALLERRAAHPAGAAISEQFGPDGGSDSDGSARADGGGAVDTESPAPGRITAFESHAWGVEGVVDGTSHLVGHPDLFASQDWSVEQSLQERVETARAAGRLPVLVGRDGAATGVVELADERREGWADVLRDLDGMGIEVVVLTGDDPAAATAFRESPVVDAVFAGVPPEGKTAVVDRLQDDAHVTMVGDGTNDAPALAQADLGIALGSGTALASDAADLALVGDDLGTVATTFALARAADRRVAWNTALALSYNAVVVPAFLLGQLTPLVAMVGVVLTGGLVAANSLRPLLSG
jgi:heavy metal translocating P-type ATPase